MIHIDKKDIWELLDVIDLRTGKRKEDTDRMSYSKALGKEYRISNIFKEHEDIAVGDLAKVESVNCGYKFYPSKIDDLILNMQIEYLRMITQNTEYVFKHKK